MQISNLSHFGRVFRNVNSRLFSVLLICSLIQCSFSVEQKSTNNKEKVVNAGNVVLSSPEECARECNTNEKPKTCYYKFTAEIYSVLTEACEICTPANNNTLHDPCQCVVGDGVERSVLAINRKIPGPGIRLCKGDTAVIDVVNMMDGMELTIHWHGILQNGSPWYDGVPMLTQCPIPHGVTFRYQWVADNPGTHFWHAHTGLQKMDGLYGSIIVGEPRCADPSGWYYDEDKPDHVMVLSDWMHELATERFPGRRKTLRGQAPQSCLINGKGRYADPITNTTTKTPLAVFTVKKGRKYRFRIICAFCSVCIAQLIIEGHRMQAFAGDGEPFVPVDVDAINSFSGERYDFVLNANQPIGTYWIQLRALGECTENKVQQFAILRYEGAPEKPTSPQPTYDDCLPMPVILNPVDGLCEEPRTDAVCISQLRSVEKVDPALLAPKPDVRIFLPFRFHQYETETLFGNKKFEPFLVPPTGRLIASLIDGISYEFPSSPPLTQSKDIPPEQFCNKNNLPPDCGKFPRCTHTYNVKLNSIVEIILIDEVGVEDLHHPFHLHGHAFKVISMGRSPDKNITKITMDHVRDLDRKGLIRRRFDLPPGKDTIPVPSNGYVIFRFRANNAGWWLFHCHFIFHPPIGMETVIHVGKESDLPPVPYGFPKCGNYVPPIKPSKIPDKQSQSH